jgi:hypothetical protein
VHIGHSVLLVAGAAAFAALAITAKGPLGVARLCGPRLHALLDVVVALALALAPLVSALRPDAAGIVVVEVVALAWLRMATLTRYRRPVVAPVTPVTPIATAAGGAAPGSGAGPGTGSRAASVLARNLGLLAGRSARRLPAAQDNLADGAREAGRQAGRVARTWRRPPA